MIKAIVTDVDGVIVGKKHGVNFPFPNISVIERLIKLQEKGIPVVLCTAKFNYAIKDIITRANLRCPHIADAGALIIDPLNDKLIKKTVFEKNLASDIVNKVIADGFYTEVYGIDDYYLQKDHIGEFTEKRIKILQKEHVEVDSLVKKIHDIEVIKIKTFVHSEKDKENIEKDLEQFKEKINIAWGQHPFTMPTKETNITVKGVSKKDATLEVLDYLKISPDEALGISDTVGDWNFMSVCKYVGVVGNESQELKDLAKLKEKGIIILGHRLTRMDF